MRPLISSDTDMIGSGQYSKACVDQYEKQWKDIAKEVMY